jgi:hypothetical protein
MRKLGRFGVALVVVAAVAGCASSKVSNRQSDVGNERIARPDHIWVHDFTVNANDLPAGSGIGAPVAGEVAPTAEDIETGRKLGAEIAKKLTTKIRAMGLPAAIADSETTPNVGDIAIYGYFASIDEGSTTKRLVVGFRSGKADLKTCVEGYLVTQSGLRKLGSGEIDSGGGKTPGLLLPIAVTVATANPVGILVGGAVKASGELSGRNTIEGAADRTATQIASELQTAFKKQGWI